MNLGAISGGARRSFEIQSDSQASLLAGGSEEFGKMISRLQNDGLDIVIVFDSSGSMQGEIDEVKAKIQRIGNALVQMIRKARISICTYRDQGDAYVVKGLQLTQRWFFFSFAQELICILQRTHQGIAVTFPQARVITHILDVKNQTVEVSQRVEKQIGQGVRRCIRGARRIG